MKFSPDLIDGYLTNNSLKKICFDGVDYAWGYRENEPVFGLINDDADGSKGFTSAMNLYWASAEYISKPWSLYIVTENSFQPQHKQMLDSLSAQYNVSIFENPDTNVIIEKISEQLNHIYKLFNQYIQDETINQGQQLAHTITNWKKNAPITETTYNVKVETGAFNLFHDQDKLQPSRKTVPVTIVSEEIQIEGILLRLVKAEESLVFDTEHRNLPMVFKLTVGSDSNLVFRFEADKSNFIEATSFFEIVHSFELTGLLTFIEPNTSSLLFKCWVSNKLEY